MRWRVSSRWWLLWRVWHYRMQRGKNDPQADACDIEICSVLLQKQSDITTKSSRYSSSSLIEEILTLRHSSTRVPYHFIGSVASPSDPTRNRVLSLNKTLFSLVVSSPIGCLERNCFLPLTAIWIRLWCYAMSRNEAPSRRRLFETTHRCRKDHWLRWLSLFATSKMLRNWDFQEQN